MYQKSSWFQPLWKILVKMGIFPIHIRMSIKHSWNQHPRVHCLEDSFFNNALLRLWLLRSNELPHPPSPSALMVLSGSSIHRQIHGLIKHPLRKLNFIVSILFGKNGSFWNRRFRWSFYRQSMVSSEICWGQTNAACNATGSPSREAHPVRALSGPDRISLWRNFPSKRFLMQIGATNGHGWWRNRFVSGVSRCKRTGLTTVLLLIDKIQKNTGWYGNYV